MSSEYCLLVEASLCVEAAERPEWPRVYSVGRPRSWSHMLSLVGDSGQVLGVLGCALTRICSLPLVLQCCSLVPRPFLVGGVKAGREGRVW